MNNNEILSEINSIAERTDKFKTDVLGYSKDELLSSGQSGKMPNRRVPRPLVGKLSPDHAKVELDGNPTTLEALQASGVLPDEMVRINKRIYMNGACLNVTGADWSEYGIMLLTGPTVSDGISKPVVVSDLGFNPQDPEIAKLLKEDK